MVLITQGHDDTGLCIAGKSLKRHASLHDDYGTSLVCDAAFACSLMPTTFIARRNVAYCLAAAKLAISHQLTAAAAGSMAGAVHGFSDAALAALPALLDDVLLLEELICRWWGRCKGLVAAMEQQVQVGDAISRAVSLLPIS